MKREIKFRAWNIDQKKMIDLKKVTPLAVNDDLGWDGLFIPFIDNAILMQYVGLKDKNGIEIYEGDIVKDHTAPHNKGTYEIIYDKYQFIGKSPNSDDYGPFMKRLYLNDQNPILEVVGNIYENPTLLK